MTNEPVKASVNPAVRTKAVISIALYAILALFSTFMAIFDFATGRTFFGVLFLLAVAIFTVLLLIKGNMVFGTYLKISDNTLCLKSWDNDFLPYDVNGGFFSDLKPSKTKMSKIPAEDISLILIGTKDFIKILIDEIELPIIVDAGIGKPSQACEAMEMGAAAIMANTAIATSGDVAAMAGAFKNAIEAGRAAYVAGLGRVLEGRASASSPLTGFLQD